MNDKHFENWIIQTAITLDDISPIIKLIGIKIVDDDHLKLAEYLVEINRLLLEFDKSETTLYILEKQKTLLIQLYEYAAAHFKREESIFTKYSFKCEKEQKEQHSIILEKINNIISDIEKGNISVNRDIKSFLLEWLLGHIQTYDYSGLSIDNWKYHIINSKNINDIQPLYKKSDMEDIDHQTEKLISNTINDFTLLNNNILDRKTLIKNIDKNVEFTLAFIKDFMVKFNLPALARFNGYKIKYKNFIEDCSKENLSNDNLKFFVLKQLFKLISIELYDLVNANKDMEFVLLNSNDENEIASFIKKTGYSIIDHDHINFVKLVITANSDLEKVTKEELSHSLSKVTETLISYAKQHFKNEEDIMDKNKNLPAINEHKSRHNEILESLNIMKFYLSKQKIEISTILRSKILNMWINHTNTLDQTTFNLK